MTAHKKKLTVDYQQTFKLTVTIRIGSKQDEGATLGVGVTEVLGLAQTVDGDDTPPQDARRLTCVVILSGEVGLLDPLVVPTL